jgi:drug/metabolite transporter (DMT)-like permease
MSSAGQVTIAVLAALGAACSFGVGVVLQHSQAQLAPPAGRAPWRLLTYLARQRIWLAGMALAVAAYGLQGLALAFGPLSLVAPLIATDLVFALPVAAAWAGRRMRAPEWAGCVLVATGVAVFLSASPPSSGQAEASARQWLLAFGAITLVSAVTVAAGLLGRRSSRPVWLAVAAGAVFALTAAVTLSLSRLLRNEGLGSIPGHWQPWALLPLGVAGLLLSAVAYQRSSLAATLPIIDTVEPVAAVLLGAALFSEPLASSPAGLTVQVSAATAAVIGIVLLGRAAGTTSRESSSAGSLHRVHMRASPDLPARQIY